MEISILTMSHTTEIGERLRQIRLAKKLTQKEFGALLKIDDNSTISKYEKGVLPIAKKAELELISTLNVNRDWLYKGVGEMFADSTSRQRTSGEDIRQQKAYGPSEDEGLIHVPIAAQAGYSKHFTDPVFLGQLKRWKIPDFPYKGDKFRIFEVEGDSMTWVDPVTNEVKGLQSGMEVVAERVEPEDWVNTTQWYIHVVVFEDYLVIKRLFREQGNKTFVLISENPDYAQKRVKVEDIREIWIMKRYLGWNTPPPKRYEITV